MLTHFVVGPTSANRYLVAYLTPGCTVPTPVADCPTADAAGQESVRLNERQLVREKALQVELAALGGAYHHNPKE